MAVCSKCKSTETETSGNEVCCANCGNVLEDYKIVHEVQFLENSRGGSSVMGQFVGADGRLNLGGYRMGGMGRESRAVTIQAAKQRIQRIASKLGIGDNTVESGMRYFKMAVNKGLTKGRKSDYIAAACLYTACRTAAGRALPYMLLDFSDALRVDVYTLGHVYLKLCQELCITDPSVHVHSPDPSIFIERYASKLEFGDRVIDVVNTANRLVGRMKRDWMVAGRRPSGICGAALLVASRIFNFNRSIKDIMKVVRIGEGTIKKRLTEFEQTPSSQLTVDEFVNQEIELEEEMDPPCFTEGLRKAKLLELEDGGEMPELLDEVERLQSELEAAFAENLLKRHRKYKKYMVGGSLDCASICSTAPSLSDLDEELAQYSDLLDDGVLKSVLEEVQQKEKLTKKEESDDEEEEEEEDEEDVEEEDMAAEVKELVKREQSGMMRMLPPEALGPRPTAASLGIKEAVEDCLNAKDDVDAADDNNGELDLTGINDEELDKLILNDEEVKIKTTIWMRENADFLKEMKEKEERKALELLENPQPKKKRQTKKRGPKVEARTAKEAIEKMLHEKKISKKINYDVLRDLTGTRQADCAVLTKMEKTTERLKDGDHDETDGTPTKKMKLEDSLTTGAIPGSSASVVIEDGEEENEEDEEEDDEEYEEEQPFDYYQQPYDDYNYDDYD